jgi:plastocyanin
MSYSWDILGDTYDGSSVSVSPTEVGQHDVELTATNEYGTATTQTTTITVNNDVPELTAANDSDRSLTAGQSGSFTVSLADSDASDTDLEFIVDGETVEERQVSQSEADETFSYQFSTPGEHSVELTAADGHGASTTIGWTVDAASRPPEFETWAPEDSNLYALTGTTFEFNATASDPDGQTVSYQWYVDNNYTASGESLTHQFNQNGEYTVQVVATDPDNTTTERSWDVVISSFNEQPIIDNQVSAVTIDENSSTEFATVSLSNPAVNNRTAEVEIIVQPPDGLSVTSATNVQSGSPAQYQVSESAQPGSSMSLTLGLQLDDEALLGRPVAVDYSIIYYPEGQRADSVVLENSTQEIVIGNQATSTRDQLTVGESGDGFTAVTTVVGAGLFAILYLRRRT